MSTTAAAAPAAAAPTAAPVLPPMATATAAELADDDSLNSAELLEDPDDDEFDEFHDALDAEEIDDEMPGFTPYSRSDHTKIFNEIKRGSKKHPPHELAQAKSSVLQHLEDISSRNCPYLRRSQGYKKCSCLSILHGNQAYQTAVCTDLEIGLT